ncbi:MAG: iron-containing alcohol dehydrogenase [Eubacteriales bacterium]
MSKEFRVPQNLVMGENALSNAMPYFQSMGRRALIVTGRTVRTLECFAELCAVLDSAGIAYSVFDGITGEPTDTMIDAGLAAYRENGCDFLIGIGGGSPLDSAKAIAALAAFGGKLRAYFGKPIEGELPPVAAIPTTAGTGSEATKFTVITDSESKVKMLLKGNALLPKLAVVDGTLTVNTPSTVTASTGLDALTHAVEAYTSRAAMPLTDALALSAVRRIFRFLPRAYADGSDREAREQMAYAALEAGICINNSSVTVVHGMSRPIGALYHVPHGLSNAMLLEKCMAFAASGAYERFAALARAAGFADSGDDDKTASACFVTALGELCRTCSVPTPAAYGIDKQVFFADVPKMAADALASGSPANTRRTVTVQDMETIYRSLYV